MSKEAKVSIEERRPINTPNKSFVIIRGEVDNGARRKEAGVLDTAVPNGSDRGPDGASHSGSISKAQCVVLNVYIVVAADNTVCQ
jgi:hypothetical protein